MQKKLQRYKGYSTEHANLMQKSLEANSEEGKKRRMEEINLVIIREYLEQLEIQISQLLKGRSWQNVI